jgi:hypothetical protein
MCTGQNPSAKTHGGSASSGALNARSSEQRKTVESETVRCMDLHRARQRAVKRCVDHRARAGPVRLRAASGSWGCEGEPHAIEAASSNATLVARVTARRAQLPCA